jgi:hypothetical protein
MFIFLPLLGHCTILVKHQLFHIVDGHKRHIWRYKLNISRHPFHCIEFLQHCKAVSSDYFDNVVALLVDELLEEHPNVV